MAPTIRVARLKNNYLKKQKQNSGLNMNDYASQGCQKFSSPWKIRDPGVAADSFTRHNLTSVASSATSDK